MAAVERERVLQLGQTLLCEIIPRVDHPTIRLRGERMQHPSAAPLTQFDGGSSERLPASGQRGRGTCLRSTSNWGSWCCSRHTGYTRTGRPTAGQIISHTPSQPQNSPAMKRENVPASVCPARTAGTAPSLHWTRPSSSGRAQLTCTGRRSYSCPTNTNNPVSFRMTLVLMLQLCLKY